MQADMVLERELRVLQPGETDYSVLGRPSKPTLTAMQFLQLAICILTRPPLLRGPLPEHVQTTTVTKYCQG